MRKISLFITVLVISLSISTSVSAATITAKEHLATYNVSMEVARSFIMGNMTNLTLVYDTCKNFGVNNDMIAEVLASDFPGLTGDVVSSFFDANGFVGSALGFSILNEGSNTNDTGEIEKLYADKKSDLYGYKFTSVEVDNIYGYKDLISIEVTCNGNFVHTWTQTYEGLSPNITLITGKTTEDDIFFESYTVYGTTPVSQIRLVGKDKFGQVHDAHKLYIGNENHEITINESCFADFACNNGMYLQTIEQVTQCN